MRKNGGGLLPPKACLIQLAQNLYALFYSLFELSPDLVFVGGGFHALVLVAEKRAQANVITRREEAASTRSLLNTAKLMDENQTLYKLKELEYIERICENVGNISFNGNGNILSQLTAILNGSNV